MLGLFPEGVFSSDASQPSQVSLELSASAVDSKIEHSSSAISGKDSGNANAITITDYDYATFAEIPMFKKRRRD